MLDPVVCCGTSTNQDVTLITQECSDLSFFFKCVYICCCCKDYSECPSVYSVPRPNLVYEVPLHLKQNLFTSIILLTIILCGINFHNVIVLPHVINTIINEVYCTSMCNKYHNKIYFYFALFLV